MRNIHLCTAVSKTRSLSPASSIVTNPMPSFISRRRATLTVPSWGRKPSFSPTWSAPSACSKPHATIGRRLTGQDKESFRFLHVSTDEVYGSLGKDDPAFLETTAYQPNSPYSASKASSDHLVRAYHHTYGLPTLTTNCSNNYGPFQFPEKLIPLMILNLLNGKPLPVYGDGLNVRDWLYVGDHCSAIATVLAGGRVGEVYNVGGLSEKKNIDVVNVLCSIMDELHPRGCAA